MVETKVVFSEIPWWLATFLGVRAFKLCWENLPRLPCLSCQPLPQIAECLNSLAVYRLLAPALKAPADQRTCHREKSVIKPKITLALNLVLINVLGWGVVGWGGV